MRLIPAIRFSYQQYASHTSNSLLIPAIRFSYQQFASRNRNTLLVPAIRFSYQQYASHTSNTLLIPAIRFSYQQYASRTRNTLLVPAIRDVDNSRKPGKLPGCERDFSGCKALLISPKCCQKIVIYLFRLFSPSLLSYLN